MSDHKKNLSVRLLNLLHLKKKSHIQEASGENRPDLHLNTSAGVAPDRKLPAARPVSAALSLATAPCVLAVMTDLWLLQLPARTQTYTERQQLQLCSDSTAGFTGGGKSRVGLEEAGRSSVGGYLQTKAPMGLRELEFRPANTDDERRTRDSEQEFSFQGKNSISYIFLQM